MNSILYMRVLLAALTCAAVGAAPVFDPVIQVSGGYTQFGGSASAQADGSIVNGGAGVTVFGSGTMTSTTGSNSLYFLWSGNGSGSFDHPLPFSADFTITTARPNFTSFWQILINITDILGNTAQTYLSGVTAPGGQQVKLNQTVNVPTGAFASWSIYLQAGGSFFAPSDVLRVSIPQGTSIDVNVPQSTVPEPANAWAMAGASTFLLGLRWMFRSRLKS